MRNKTRTLAALIVAGTPYDRRRKLTDAARADIADRLKRGQTAASLAREYGVTPRTVGIVAHPERVQAWGNRKADPAMMARANKRRTPRKLALLRLLKRRGELPAAVLAEMAKA